MTKKRNGFISAYDQIIRKKKVKKKGRQTYAYIQSFNDNKNHGKGEGNWTKTLFSPPLAEKPNNSACRNPFENAYNCSKKI